MKKPKIAKVLEVDLTAAEIEKFQEQFGLNIYDEDTEPKHDEPEEEPVLDLCVVCKGTIVAKITREYRGDPMMRIIGPGGRNQISTIHHGYHCSKCGLKYEFPPKMNE